MIIHILHNYERYLSYLCFDINLSLVCHRTGMRLSNGMQKCSCSFIRGAIRYLLSSKPGTGGRFPSPVPRVGRRFLFLEGRVNRKIQRGIHLGEISSFDASGSLILPLLMMMTRPYRCRSLVLTIIWVLWQIQFGA